jgi:Kdo2-lipid IVA lauroyltransferase/acyltransferase
VSGHPQRYAVEAAAAAIVGRTLPAAPSRLVRGVGRVLGHAWATVDRRHVKIAEDALALSFPDWPRERVVATARGVYRHFATVLCDVLWMSGRSREEVLARVRLEGREHVEDAQARGRGVLYVTGHFGNWELHGLAHSWLFGPIGVIARPLDNPALDRRLCAARTRGGNTVIPKQRALAHVLRLLRQGGGAAVLIDQNVLREDGVFVDFLGRKAATTTVAAALAVKTGCVLVPSRTELEDDGSYRLIYEAPVAVDPARERGAEIHRVTQELTARIESWVRRRPEQWLWLHRRWKTQP